MNSRKVTLAEQLLFSSTRSSSVDIPLNGLIHQIRIRVTGTYTGTDGNLNAEFPYNIFRNLSLSMSSGYTPYSLASKDMRILNYLDKKGKVTTSAASGAYEMNIVLDRGAIIAVKKDGLPEKVTHPALPVGSITLAVTWANDLDCGVTDIVLATGTGVIEIEETPVTKAELQDLYGETLERYQLPQVLTQGDVDITSNTAPLKVLKPTTGGLKRRIVIITSNTSSVRTNTIVSKFQLKNTQVGQEQVPLDRQFLSAQNEDKEQYDLSTALTGVASIDILREITNDRHGMRSWDFEEKLELHTQNASNGKLRIIEENMIVVPAQFLAAVASGLL